MDSLCKKISNYLKSVFKSDAIISCEDENLSIDIDIDGYDTLVKKGMFFKNGYTG
jgi:hypothetical protein